MTRRNLLISVPLLGSFSAGYAFGVEPRWFDTVVQPVKLAGLTGKLRILHLSDFHASSEVPFSVIEAAVELGLQSKPELICLTGDFVTRYEPLDWGRYIRIVRRMSDAAPTFGVLGNHDGGFWAQTRDGHADPTVVVKFLEQSRVTLLNNASRTVSVRNVDIRIAGLGDLWSREVDASLALNTAASEIPTVLLAHNPDTKDVIDAYSWDLMLSGHTHGGQVLVPLVGESFAPVRDKRFVAGLKSWGNRQIYVTRGVGSLGGVRFNCRPEVTVLDLQG